MGVLNLVLWAAGVALIALGYTRARGPWQRLQALKEQDRNAERYSAWRGGVRASSGAGQTGASVAMEILRRQARTGAILMGVGFLLVLAGFAIR